MPGECAPDYRTMIPARQFYFLRHGQTDWNVRRLAQGTADIALNSTGLDEAARAAVELRDIGRIDAIVSSPLRRALQTATIVAETLGLPVQTDDTLAECDFGVEQGQPIGPWHSDWIDGVTPEGADPYDAYLVQSAQALGRAISGSGTTLIVAHGGTYMAVTKFLLLLRPRKPPPNCVPLLHTPPEEPGTSWTVAPIVASS